LCHAELVFRLLGLLGGLSVATDMGTGAPLEESLRRTLVAVRLARLLGLADAEVADVLYTSLLQHLGCTAFAHESGQIWGEDDITLTRVALKTDFSRPSEVWRTWVGGVAQTSGVSRARAGTRTLMSARRMGEGPRATCEVAREASALLGLAPAVQEALFHGLAQWNGKGYPRSRGEQIPLPTRIMQVASIAVMFTLDSGPDAALAKVREWSGRVLDPELCAVLAVRSGPLLEGIEELDAHRELLDVEPDPVQLIDESRVLTVARTLGHMADLMSPWLHGHSAAVADLAVGAAERLELHADLAQLRVAGHLHDLGRVAVPSRIWDKPAALSTSELDQARMHPHHGERVVARVPELDRVAPLVGQHHERCDGSGYHRGLTAAQLSMPSRVLAAADRYRVLVEGRPHRAALPSALAAERLRAAAVEGRLDPDAVSAVQAEAGQVAHGRRISPAGLTRRQLEVLRLVAEGVSNPGIAERLVISRRTAEHHVQDVYLKIGASTRAGAALFAMEHGLLDRSG
jgi:HD-GYP domain-containing protein (c-di-GMP phosphodiesterase class II)